MQKRKYASITNKVSINTSWWASQTDILKRS